MKHVDPKDIRFDDFVSWIEKQPARKRYRWGDADNCAIGQYAHSLGFNGAGDDCLPYFAYSYLEGGSDNEYKRGVPGHVALSHPHTFGALLERAKKVQPFMPERAALHRRAA